MYKILQLMRPATTTTPALWSYVQTSTTVSAVTTVSDYHTNVLSELNAKLTELLKTIPANEMYAVKDIDETISVTTAES